MKGPNLVKSMEKKMGGLAAHYMGLACNIAWRAPVATADTFAELVPNWS